MDQELLTLNFNESVIASSLTVTRIILQNVAAWNSSEIACTLTGGATLSLNRLPAVGCFNHARWL